MRARVPRHGAWDVMHVDASGKTRSNHTQHTAASAWRCKRDACDRNPAIQKERGFLFLGYWQAIWRHATAPCSAWKNKASASAVIAVITAITEMAAIE